MGSPIRPIAPADATATTGGASWLAKHLPQNTIGASDAPMPPSSLGERLAQQFLSLAQSAGHALFIEPGEHLNKAIQAVQGGNSPSTAANEALLALGTAAGNVVAPEKEVPEAAAATTARDAITKFRAVDPEAFNAALANHAAAMPSEAPFITHRTADEMRAQGMRTFLSPDGTAGYALGKNPDGKMDIRNVFNFGAKGQGAHALADALSNGGQVLDHFDTNLGNFYRDFGFQEYTPQGETSPRLPFSDLYAPEGWDYEKYGRPDVVYQQHPQSGMLTPQQYLDQYSTARAARKAPTPRATVVDRTAREPALALTDAGALPPQQDLPRFVGPRIPQERIDDVEQEALKTFRSPAFEELTRNGQFADWYNTVRTLQRARDAQGDVEGPQSYQRLMDMMAATTARSAPPNNLRRASYYRALEQAALLDPDALRSGVYKAVPEGMGHFANNAHHSALANLLEEGGINSLTNPKPAGFTANLTRNFRPYTNDTRMATGTALENPNLVSLGAIVKSVGKDGGVTFSPRDWAYAPMERAAQTAAHEYAGRGLLNVPAGADPTAYWQAKVWDALASKLPGASPNVGTMDDIVDQALSRNASLWGVNHTTANSLFWHGHPLDLPLGTDVIPRGLLGLFAR